MCTLDTSDRLVKLINVCVTSPSVFNIDHILCLLCWFESLCAWTNLKVSIIHRVQCEGRAGERYVWTWMQLHAMTPRVAVALTGDLQHRVEYSAPPCRGCNACLFMCGPSLCWNVLCEKKLSSSHLCTKPHRAGLICRVSRSRTEFKAIAWPSKAQMQGSWKEATEVRARVKLSRRTHAPNDILSIFSDSFQILLQLIPESMKGFRAVIVPLHQPRPSNLALNRNRND